MDKSDLPGYVSNLKQKWVLQRVSHWTCPVNDAMGATKDWVLDSLHRTEGLRNPIGYGR